MRGKRFNAESLRCVMAAQQKIHSQLFSGNNCPMRSFAGDKGVDIFLSHAVDLRASGAGDNADGAGLLRPEIERFHRSVQRSGESANELFSRWFRLQCNHSVGDPSVPVYQGMERWQEWERIVAEP